MHDTGVQIFFYAISVLQIRQSLYFSLFKSNNNTIDTYKIYKHVLNFCHIFAATKLLGKSQNRKSLYTENEWAVGWFRALVVGSEVEEHPTLEQMAETKTKTSRCSPTVSSNLRFGGQNKMGADTLISHICAGMQVAGSRYASMRVSGNRLRLATYDLPLLTIGSTGDRNVCTQIK